MKILVTGGAGFIGSHLVDAYINEGHQVAIIDNLSSGKQENLNPKAKFYNIDITSEGIFEVINDFKPEIVNHHAAQIEVRKSVDDPKFDAKVNILGGLNLLETVRKVGSVKKIIFASTGGAIYGDADKMPTDEKYDAWPISPYGIAKQAVEHYLHYYKEIYNIPFIALRYANVYGPRQNPHGEAGVVAIFYKRILSNKEFKINGSGKQTRDFVYVKDVVKANVKATHTETTGLFNIGTSKETSINHLIKTMQKAINHPGEIPHGPAKPGEQQRSSLSYQKAKNILNWEPSVPIDEGLQQTSEYFKSKQ